MPKGGLVSMSGETPPSQTSVFISYSRADSAFARDLAAALEGRGYLAVYDRSELGHVRDAELVLSAQDEWWLQLKSMIAAATIMVFVVSEASKSSRVCDDEIAHAKYLGKRVIGVLRQAVDFNTCPERLRALNVSIDMRPEVPSQFRAGLEQLCAGIEVDMDWYRFVGRTARRAEQWDQGGRPRDLLLRMGEVDDADRWILRRPASAERPGALLLLYIEASRDFERASRDGLRRVLTRGFVAPIENAVRDGLGDRAIRLMAAAAVLGDDLNFSLETPSPVLRAGAMALSLPLPKAVLHGHLDAITATTWFADGTRIATASLDGSARVWDVATGKEMWRTDRPDGFCACVVWSNDGQWLAVASNSEAVVCRSDTGEEVAVLAGHDGYVLSIAWSHDDGSLRTVSTGGTLGVWGRSGGRTHPARLVNPGEVSHVAWCSDGVRVLLVCGGIPRILNAATGDETANFRGHTGSVVAAAWSPSGEKVATVGDNSLRIWDPNTGEELAWFIPLDFGEDVLCLAWSRDGTRVLTGASDGSVRLWKVDDGEELLTIQGHRAAVVVLAWSPDSALFLSACGDGTCVVWDGCSGEEVGRLRGHSGTITEAAWSADGGAIATASVDSHCRIWDVCFGAEIRRVAGDQAYVVDASVLSSGSYATASGDGSVRLWPVERAEQPVVLKGHTDSATVVRHSPGGGHVATGGVDGRVIVWNALNGKSQFQIGMLADRPTALEWSPDGTWILVGTETGDMWSIDARTGRVQLRFTAHSSRVRCVAWSPNGDAFISGCQDGTAVVWVASAGTKRVALSSHDEGVCCVGWSPDGLYVATGGDDGKLFVADAASGHLLSGLLEHDAGVNALAWSPNGSCIISASDDGTVAIWSSSASTVLWRSERGSNAVECVVWSRDGGRVATAAGHEVTIWDAVTGARLMQIRGHFDVIGLAWFGPGRLDVLYQDGALRSWDVAATGWDVAPRVVIAAALANGVGRRDSWERASLLLESAPDDLYEALVRGMDSAESEAVHSRSMRMVSGAHSDRSSPSARGWVNLSIPEEDSDEDLAELELSGVGPRTWYNPWYFLLAGSVCALVAMLGDWLSVLTLLGLM